MEVLVRFDQVGDGGIASFTSSRGDPSVTAAFAPKVGVFCWFSIVILELVWGCSESFGSINLVLVVVVVVLTFDSGVLYWLESQHVGE